MRGIAVVLLIVGFFCFLSQPVAQARQGLIAGRAQGVVSVDVAKTTIEKVGEALKKVFVGDGFKVVSESSDQIVFERPARMSKDLSYGGVINEGGTWERLVIVITNTGEGRFTLQCNPVMVSNKGEGIFEDETEVLRMFAGEYRRLLSRAKAQM